MKVSAFLKDKSGFFLLFCAEILLTVLFMTAYRSSAEQTVFIVTVISLCNTIRLVYEYMRKKSFYDKMATDCDRLDKKYLLCEMLEQPAFSEGRLFYDILYRTNKSMCENVSHYRRQAEDFREYIELWVHEVKLPVAALSLIAHNDTENGSRYSGQIKRVDSYIENVLYYARSENAEKDYMIKEISLKQAVRDAVVRSREEIQLSGISVNTSGLEKNVLTDIKWLEFILTQLIDNSIKYRDKDRNPEININALQTQNGVTLCFRDNGIGVNPAECERVFEKSFTGSNGRNGANSTGMGLYIVKRLCDKLGHTVTLTSKQGEYTEVSITFKNSGILELMH